MRMKRIVRKLATAILAGALAFSMVPATVQAVGWKQNKNGYWWQENDYSYPKNQWKTIYGKQYHFNSGGYMDTDWTKVDGKWYYLGGKNDGAKKTYWYKVRGKYYWLGSNGVMRTGWQKVYNKKYYYLGGANDGAMKTGWQKIGRYWYWLGNDGDMKSGWQTIYKKKYYLGGPNDGAMKTGWQQIGGYWYYFGKSGESNEGVLRTNTWVDGYYVDGNGRWDKTKKIDVGDYLTNKKDMQLINILGLKRQSSGYGKTYAKGKITYYYVESGHTYGITNEGNQYVTIYGIVPGNSLSDIKRVLKPKNWKQAKENYKNNEGSPYLFIKEIGSRSYMIEVETNSYGIITQWYVMNWPQGEFMFPENLKDISVQASLDDSSTGVVLNAEESENLKTNTDGAQVSEQEENTTVEENTEEQETEPEVQEAETPEENVDEIETPENEDTDVDSEEIIEETEEVEE